MFPFPIAEYVTFSQAQRIYIFVIYTWTLYNYADSCYSTVKKVYRVANTAASLSNAAYRKLIIRKSVPKVELTTIKPQKSLPEVELKPVQTQEQIAKTIPASLDDFIVEYFGA